MHSKHIKHLVTILLLASALIAAIGSLGDPFFDLLVAAPAVLFAACVIALVLWLDAAWDVSAHVIRVSTRRPGALQTIIETFRERCPHCEDVTANVWATLVATGVLHYVYGHGISWFALFAFALTYGAATLRLALLRHCHRICDRIVANYEKQLSAAPIPAEHPDRFPN
jgi:hypothetical protein